MHKSLIIPFFFVIGGGFGGGFGGGYGGGYGNFFKFNLIKLLNPNKESLNLLQKKYYMIKI